MTENTKTATFPQRVMALLDDEDAQQSIHWLPDGRVFKIHKPEEFEKEVLTKYFNSIKLDSFVIRLKSECIALLDLYVSTFHIHIWTHLHLPVCCVHIYQEWGFARVDDKCNARYLSYSFTCPLFQRDQPHFALLMKLKNKKGNKPQRRRPDTISSLPTFPAPVPSVNFNHPQPQLHPANHMMMFPLASYPSQAVKPTIGETRPQLVSTYSYPPPPQPQWQLAQGPPQPRIGSSTIYRGGNASYPTILFHQHPTCVSSPPPIENTKGCPLRLPPTIHQLLPLYNPVSQGNPPNIGHKQPTYEMKHPAHNHRPAVGTGPKADLQTNEKKKGYTLPLPPLIHQYNPESQESPLNTGYEQPADETKNSTHSPEVETGSKADSKEAEAAVAMMSLAQCSFSIK